VSSGIRAAEVAAIRGNFRTVWGHAADRIRPVVENIQPDTGRDAP
jgi:hypothetical protein